MFKVLGDPLGQKLGTLMQSWLTISKLIKILQVKLPIECPFHPDRDIFGPQEAMKKQHRPSQWGCGICGKSFFEERYLDMHFDNRHKGHINMVSTPDNQSVQSHP